MTFKSIWKEGETVNIYQVNVKRKFKTLVVGKININY